jgi:hypothetical protein
MPELYAKNDEKHGVADTIRLTDAERDAILTAADLLIGSRPGAVLRKLLERLA